MKKTLDGLQKAENLMIIVTFSVMVLASFAQVVNRNIFQLSIGWFEELAVYCMIWMALLGTEMGLRDGTQAAVTAIVDRFHGKGKLLVQILAKAFVVAFTAIMTVASWSMVAKQIRIGQTTAALKIPMAVPYAALFFAFAIMTAVQGITLIVWLKNLASSNTPKSDPNGGEAS
jgi:TRAP-type C4-dicarboxylate transport system permease small subunit